VVTRGRRKIRTGAVVRVKQDKTAVVEMVWKQRHRLYRKQVRRVARFRSRSGKSVSHRRLGPN
jgi:ribosomal protein S17